MEKEKLLPLLLKTLELENEKLCKEIWLKENCRNVSEGKFEYILGQHKVFSTKKDLDIKWFK